MMQCDNPETEHPGYPCNHPDDVKSYAVEVYTRRDLRYGFAPYLVIDERWGAPIPSFSEAVDLACALSGTLPGSVFRPIRRTVNRVSNLVGHKVIAATDDRSCPCVGTIVAVHDPERVSVRWTDWRSMGSAVTTTERRQ